MFLGTHCSGDWQNCFINHRWFRFTPRSALFAYINIGKVPIGVEKAICCLADDSDDKIFKLLIIPPPADDKFADFWLQFYWISSRKVFSPLSCTITVDKFLWLQEIRFSHLPERCRNFHFSHFLVVIHRRAIASPFATSTPCRLIGKVIKFSPRAHILNLLLCDLNCCAITS